VKPWKFEDYKDKYDCIELTRTDDGVLTLRLHDIDEPDKPIRYYGDDRPYNFTNAHVEWSYCFYDIARDYDNEVVIITGTDDMFIPIEQDGKAANAGLVGEFPAMKPQQFDHIYHNGKHIQMNLLNIDVPVIAAINGDAYSHSELLFNSDIVICAEDAVFQDQAHFDSGLFAPGDGIGLIWPKLMGPTRASYYLLTGKTFTAQEALEWGMVNEVLPRDQVLPRANELAQEILKRPKLIRRYSRQIFKQEMKKLILDQLGYGLALEGMSAAARELNEGVPADGGPNAWAALGPESFE
jgi:enoyl-CoA hydratase/carnithine racemase